VTSARAAAATSPAPGTGAGGDFVGTGGAGGGGSDLTACDGPGQCMAVSASCCGTCGVGDVSAYVGVNIKHVDEFRMRQCSVPIACPAIACLNDGTGANIGARCVAGQCQVFDVRKVPEYSACNMDTDCHLRLGLSCCTCGGNSGGWVAVSSGGEQGIAAAECAPDTACPDCLPVPPAKTLASCNNHVCQVLLAP
jgi:hypothetical protein